MKTFTYRKSYKFINWGISFDSQLEMKYALSIRKDYEYLRSHIPIYYDPRTKQPTNYIRDNIRRYTPDFLIRHKITKQAFLIETKPRDFEHNEQLILRKEVAENYIRSHNYDWSFKVVFDDEIILTGNEQAQFDECRALRQATGWKLLFQKLNDRYDRSRTSLFTIPPSSGLVRFVMFGEWDNKQRSSVLSSPGSL